MERVCFAAINHVNLFKMDSDDDVKVVGEESFCSTPDIDDHPFINLSVDMSSRSSNKTLCDVEIVAEENFSSSDERTAIPDDDCSSFIDLSVDVPSRSSSEIITLSSDEDESLPFPKKTKNS